jgi:hypothetical protein
MKKPRRHAIGFRLILLALLCPAGFASAADDGPGPVAEVSARFDVRVPMRDGIELSGLSFGFTWSRAMSD